MSGATGASIEGLLREELKGVQQRIAVKRDELRPLEEEERKLERMIREYTSGSMGSGDITDEQIVSWIRRNSHENDRRTTQEIAKAFDGDGRGFSKRLPRMVRDGLIAGDSKAGYYITTSRTTPARKRATA